MECVPARLRGALPLHRSLAGTSAPLSRKTPALAPCLLALVLTACHSIGPRTVPRDRSDYSGSISESWKRQTLLNIVKLRYLDPPIFVDVGQIVAGYQLQLGASVGGQISSAGAMQGNNLNLGATGTFVDRPTITYTPLTGKKFVKGLITPLPPDSVFFTIQSGWPADAVSLVAVAEMNGLKNQVTGISGVSPPAPEFLRALALLRRIQVSGAVAMRIKPDPEQKQTSILTFQSKSISPETAEDIRELRSLLGLSQEATEFNLVSGATATHDKELAVITRSMMQQLITLASQVDVPAEDIARGRATPGWESLASQTNAVRLIQIHSAQSRPADAFVSVNYRGHWFWIDDRDIKSKRVFSFIMMLFTMVDTGEKETPPVLTIPAQ